MIKVFFEAWRGRYSDNPRAISELIAERAGVRRTWASDGSAFPAGVPTVRRLSPAYFARLLTTDILITNDIVSRQYVKAPGMTYVQCWHGTPLKAIGRHDDKHAYDGSDVHARRTERDVKMWDYLLSPAPVITPILRSAFGYDGPVLEIGYPRNDVLSLDTDDAIRRRVRSQLGIGERSTVILYAPTWRDDSLDADGNFTQEVEPEWSSVTDAVADCVVLFRAHRNVTSTHASDDRVLDVSSYRDIAELYLAADVLISDYSSTIYDFAITRKPVICYSPDLEHYRNDLRFMYFTYEEWAPGPIVATTADLVDCLRDLPAISTEYKARYSAFVEKFCPFEDGGASQRLVEAVPALSRIN